MVKINEPEKFENVSQFQKINNKIAYLCHKVQDKIYVKYGDKEYGPYESANGIVKFKDGVAYMVGENNKFSIYLDGECKSKAYPDFWFQIVEWGGEPLYQAQTNEGRVLMHGDKQIAGPYPFTHQHKVYDGIIYLAARKENGKMVLLSIKDGTITEGPEYKGVGSPVKVNNKVVYGAKKDDDLQLIVYDGQELSVYEEIGRIQEIHNKLVYTARKAQNEWYVVYDGKEFGPNYQIGPIIEYEGGIAYNASDKEGKIWNIYKNGEKQNEPASKGIGHLSIVHDKLAYVYLNKRGWCYVRVGDKDFPKEYRSAKHIMEWGDDVVFAAEQGKDKLEWRLSINGIEHGEKRYREILAMVPIQNKLYMSCFSSENFRHYIQIVEKD